MAKKAILESYSCDSESHFNWALDLATRNKVPWLEKIARTRMETILEGPMKWDGCHLETPHPDVPSDEYDDLLLTLAELGSPLHEKELAYLQYYGYLCEPRKRLAEILEEKQYPR